MKQIAITYIFPSGSDSGKRYQTLEYSDGSTSCDCPGWTRRIQPDGSRTCRHVREIAAGIAGGTALRVLRSDHEERKPILAQAILPTKTGRAFDFSL